MTFPTMTELISSGLTFPATSAALEACTIRSVDEVLTNLPPKVPKAVRFAATMKTSDTAIKEKEKCLYSNSYNVDYTESLIKEI